ncbi:hypothetical protein SDC9_133156 [bioreactor metagenome]|uniref:Uncharacterized protein n=1 Tax=bioreactor metagenome TaxID=1076179 RepID=A0A645DAW6_9ZZZZ
MATIHSGIVGGTLNASSNPVTTALKSLIIIGLLVIFWKAYSDKTAEPTAVKITNNAFNPKK